MSREGNIWCVLGGGNTFTFVKPKPPSHYTIILQGSGTNEPCLVWFCFVGNEAVRQRRFYLIGRGQFDPIFCSILFYFEQRVGRGGGGAQRTLFYLLFSLGAFRGKA